jgi:hypothetical protein
MNAEQISTWIGIAGALGGVAMTFVLCQNCIMLRKSALWNVD